MTPKVTIGIPSTDYVHLYFALSLSRVTKATKAPLSLATGKGSNICKNRNLLVHMAHEAQAEFLLFIDNDLSFPPHTIDHMVEIADERKLDILGCNYLLKQPPHKSLYTLKKDCRNQEFTGIDEVARLPTGMMLIRMKVFERLKPPYFIYEPLYEDGIETVGTEDYPFCDRARNAGIAIWMDFLLSFELVHWTGQMGVQWIPEPPWYKYVTELSP